MGTIIDITQIIELKNVLSEKFDTKLHLHDSCSGQYFSTEDISASGIDYIKNYFSEKGYYPIFNSNYTEFYLEESRKC